VKRTVILAVGGVILAGAGVVFGRYVIPDNTVVAATRNADTASPSFSATTSTVPPVNTSRAPQNGTYSDGTEVNYFVSLTSQASGTLDGSVQFAYQDGQTSVVFTFTGTWQDGIATLTPGSIPQTGSASQDPATVPSTISMQYAQSSLDLGECTAYLHFVESESQCQFTFSPSG